MALAAGLSASAYRTGRRSLSSHQLVGDAGMSSSLFNAVTITASIVALITSIVFALRQSRLMRYASDIPVMIDLFDEFRSSDFVRRERYVWTALGSDADPAQGFQGMPDDVYESAYNVCAYYQMVAYLVAFGRLDSRLAILPLHYRAIRTWSVVKPYVEGERILRGDRYSFLNFFEDFALMCEKVSLDDLYLPIRRQEFRHRRWSRSHRKRRGIPDVRVPAGGAGRNIPSEAGDHSA